MNNKRKTLNYIALSVVLIIVAILFSIININVFSLKEKTQKVEAETIGDFTVNNNKITAYNGTALELYPEDFPTGVTTIEIRAFTNTSVKKVVLPDYITVLGASAFYGSNIEEIVLPSTMTSIGSGAFYRCTSLHTVYCCFTNPSVFILAPFSYTPDDFVMYVPYDAYNSFYGALNLSTHKNKVSRLQLDITFDAGNGETINDGSVYFGSTYSNLPTPTKEGYDFEGWYDSDDNLVENGYTCNKIEDIALHAVWSKKEYALKISYNNNNYWIKSDNTISTNIEYVEYGTQLNINTIKDNLALAIQRAGYKITDLTYNNMTMNNVVQDYGSNHSTVNLTPVFSQKIYSLTYITSTEIYGSHTINGLVYGESITLPTLVNSDKEGYTYIGWYVTGTNTVFTDTSVGNWNGYTNADCNYSVTAKWSANSYTVVLDYNDGIGTTTTTSVTYGFMTFFPTPARTGYVFEGWMYNNKAYFRDTYWDVPDDVTLVAQWSIATYDIYYYNIGDAVLVSGTYVDSYTYFDTITLPVLKKDGYVFEGWKDQNDNFISVVTSRTGLLRLTATFRQTLINITNAGTYTIDQDEVVYLDLTRLVATRICTYNIASNVKEIYVRSTASQGFSSQTVNINTRNTAFTLILDNVTFLNVQGSVINANDCPTLTIKAIGDCLLGGAQFLDLGSNSDSSTVVCNDLIIIGNNLTINGKAGDLANGTTHLPCNGRAAIYSKGSVTASCSNLYLTGGQGGPAAAGTSGSGYNAGQGGIAIDFSSSTTRKLTISNNCHIELIGGKGGNVEIDNANEVSNKAGNGNYALINTTIVGFKSTDVLKGGDGGDIIVKIPGVTPNSNNVGTKSLAVYNCQGGFLSTSGVNGSIIYNLNAN